MSDRDYLDFDDDLQDEGPDAPVGEWDEDLMDGFPADDPAADDTAVEQPVAPSAKDVAPAAMTEDPMVGKEPTKAKGVPKHRRRGPRDRGTGALCFLLVLLAGLTLGSGLLTATGAAPETLLDFSGFADPVAIGDFQAHPINAFWLAAVVTLLAAVLAAVAVDKRLRGFSHATGDQEDILEAIRQLDPEDPATWQREELQADSDVAAVTSGLLGHYNLQQAKLERYVGLEGELHRLEKAMADENQDDLQGNWENPAAGSLADQALRLVQPSENLDSDSLRRQQAVSDQGPDLVSGLSDAKSWHVATADQVKLQGAGIERVFRHLSKLAENAVEADDLAPRRDRLRQAIEAVREELAVLPTRATGGESDDGSLGTLIERASRLAFQIAMEVARLGAKGERLLPLTQDLEELTTELRAMMDGGARRSGEDDPRDKALANVRGRLAELDPDILGSSGSETYASAVKELAPAAGEVAAGLANLTKNFGVQNDRLQQLQQLASAITGVEATDAGNPDAALGSGMLVDRFDPFASGAQPEGGLVTDPFAGSSGNSIFEPDTAAADDDFGRTVLPGEDADAEPTPTVEPAAELTLDPIPAPAPPPPVDSPLPLDAEKVYDLSEFDAQPVVDAPPVADEQPVAEPATDRIHELSEFGAVKIE